MSDQNSTSNHQPETLTDAKLSQLYQTMPKATPTTELDNKITAMAASHLSTVRKPTKGVISTWRRLQWPTSIAASVIFISFMVYIQYDRFEPSLSAPNGVAVDPYAIADEATLNEQRAAEKALLATRQKSSQQRQSAPQSFVQADMNISAEMETQKPELSQYAEKEALTLAAKALDDINVEPLSLDMQADINIDIGLGATDANRLTSARREGKTSEYLGDIEALNVTGSRVASKSDLSMEVNTDYLDNLLGQYSSLSATTEDKTGLSESATQLISIQLSIYDYLTLLRTAMPKWIIDEKYLQVLTQQQRDKLLLEKSEQ
ncbi:hypothetical protein [Aliiglaciecola sp. LCG003]|uniref:hypothetical protein n=1 Tax=Aliiglaciecola sp. LCG003 TaxID=3053655 RepID=UPI002573B668|nr:hypothetical protein [Aliiglaciecola sp. LCG003]WJG10809.1 hypothetical protein QR722_07160 [Aliiglaciecola sp. LCG003]